MKPSPRILATSDFSEASRLAVERAGLLAAETGARLTLTHVLHQLSLDALREALGDRADTAERALIAQAEAALAALGGTASASGGAAAPAHAGTAARAPSPSAAEVRLQKGAAVREIAACADEIDADLVVVGARGAGSMRRLLLGSTSERLVRRLQRSVLVVRQAPHGPYRRVLVPVDFSDCTRAAIEAARLVAPEAQIVLLHAYEAPFEAQLRYAGVRNDELETYREQARRSALRRLEQLASELDLPAERLRVRLLHGDPSATILSQEIDCDLIVMGKHGQGAIEHFLLGSVTMHVLSASEQDVLVACLRPDQP